MKPKKIKIKHRKYNLYNRKKSKGKQALTVILTIVAAIALCVVGFGLGRPLMDYFQGKNNPDTSSSALPTESTTAATSETTTVTATDNSSESTPEEIKPASAIVHTLDEAYLANEEKLDRALNTLKKQGCTEVIVTLKNADGHFMYLTEISDVKGSDAVIGTLTAKQIYDAINSAGIKASARISTLKDPIVPNFMEGIRYTTNDGYGWMDASPENGGKFWLSPFSDKTAQYLAAITGELAAAGFDRIILNDTVYPFFHDVDYNLYLSNMPELQDQNKRVAALWSVIEACEKAATNSGAELMLQLDGNDLYASDKLNTTAEAAGDKTKLKTVRLLISYTADGNNVYADARAFTGKMSGVMNGQKYAVLISDKISPNAKSELERAFSEGKIDIYYE